MIFLIMLEDSMNHIMSLSGANEHPYLCSFNGYSLGEYCYRSTSQSLYNDDRSSSSSNNIYNSSYYKYS